MEEIANKLINAKEKSTRSPIYSKEIYELSKEYCDINKLYKERMNAYLSIGYDFVLATELVIFENEFER